MKMRLCGTQPSSTHSWLSSPSGARVAPWLMAECVGVCALEGGGMGSMTL